MRAGEEDVVVLSESLARHRWPNEDPIEKQWKDGKDTVIGVVGNTRTMELNNTDATEIYYSAHNRADAGDVRASHNRGVHTRDSVDHLEP